MFENGQPTTCDEFFGKKGGPLSALSQAKLAGWTAYQFSKLEASSDNRYDSTGHKHKVCEEGWTAAWSGNPRYGRKLNFCLQQIISEQIFGSLEMCEVAPAWASRDL